MNMTHYFRGFPLTIALALGSLAGVTLAAAPAGFRGGSYQGLIDLDGELNPARVQFTAVGAGWSAQVQIEGREQALPATVALAGNELSLQLPGPNGTVRCVGAIDGPAVVAPPAAAGCRLELVASEDHGLAERLKGGWLDDEGQAYAIARSGDSPAPMWLDYQTGAWRQLVERDGALHAGTRIGSPWPQAFSLQPDGADMRLRTGPSDAGRRLHRLAVSEQPLAWSGGDATLKGTLILPPGKGPFPAVVLTHMSSPAIRDGYLEFAYFFAARGIAALVYDRRGSGESTGSEGSAGMQRLADDAVAAAEALAALPQIDARRIGTWGHSQGGWIAPVAAARSSRISFVIAQSASGVSPALQEMFRVEHNARDAGLSEAEVVAALDYERRLMEWVRSGAGRDEIHALTKANQNARWARFVELNDNLPDKPSARSQSFWWFDPAPELAQVRVPVLVIHGDRDGYVPVEASLPILRRALAGTEAEFHLLPRAAHGLWVGEADSGREAVRSPGFHPDYWPLLRRWLQAHALGQPPAPTCEALLQAHLKTDLSLPYETFDQTEGQGFRVLAAEGCNKEGADLIEAYLRGRPSAESSLRWHVAQLRASAGQAAEAIVAARSVLNPREDLAKDPFRWNDYVLATIAFLERDKAALQRHRDKVAEGRDAHMGNAMNLKLLDALIKYFDTSYAYATSRIGQ